MKSIFASRKHEGNGEMSEDVFLATVLAKQENQHLLENSIFRRKPTVNEDPDFPDQHLRGLSANRRAPARVTNEETLATPKAIS